MSLGTSANLQAVLDNAESNGLDVNWICQVFWPAPVGTRYYAWRAVTLAGNVYEAKLMGAPAVAKQSDLDPLRLDALNDGVSLVLRNCPENEQGEPDVARVQDLMADAPLGGVLVKLGFCDQRVTAGGEADVKWDGLYRVDRIRRTTQVVELFCVDALLHPGEKRVGSPVTDLDWPLAPSESYGLVRGPAFGKLEDVPLVPVEVGLTATLEAEIDAQDTVIDLVGDLKDWPNSGFVEIGDEIVQYQAIDRSVKRLSGVVRGVGYPGTTPASHAGGAVIRELYSGRESTLVSGITAGSTSLQMSGDAILNVVGTTQPRLLIDDEVLSYTTRSGGNTIGGLIRGLPVPTIAGVHDAGTVVRTIPAGPDGAPRYRYLVAEGLVAAVGNVRVVDEGGNEQAFAGNVTLSQVTAPSGRVWSVVDLDRRPRLDQFEAGVSAVAQDWMVTTDGRKNGNQDYMGADSFLRWKVGPQMSAGLSDEFPLVLDPASGGQALILKAVSGQNVFDAVFNAHWDEGLNNPRRLWGRFVRARLRLRVQYDRQTTTTAGVQILKDGQVWRTRSVVPPTVSATGGDGSITGQQVLPKSRWGTTLQKMNLRLASFGTKTWQGGTNVGAWVSPFRWNPLLTITPNGLADLEDAVGGNPNRFVCGLWNGGTGPTYSLDGTGVVGSAFLVQTDVLPTNTGDQLVSATVQILNPVDPAASNTPAYTWTGWDGKIRFYKDKARTQLFKQEDIWISFNDASRVHTINFPAGTSWDKVQAVVVEIPQFGRKTTLVPGFGTYYVGTVLGAVSVSLNYLPDLEGQRADTVVDGSYFSASGTNVPTQVFEQVVSLDRVVKDWSAFMGLDPWMFFSKDAPEGPEGGMGIRITLDPAADQVQFAIGEVVLELEYQAPATVFDGTLVADVDGRTGTPVGGGATTVLQNPVDLLAYLVDGAEFYDAAAYRDAASFAAVRPLAEAVGWRCSRLVDREVAVRDLVASLCGESRLLMLFDEGKVYARWRTVDALAQDSVGVLGVQEDQARYLVRDDFTIDNRVDALFNSIGFYYRRNLRTQDFRAVVEVKDAASQALSWGVRRETVDLHWHQSARGYAGGFAAQKAAVSALAEFGISMACRLWDFATVEVSAAAAEPLQRYDVVTLNYPRAGLAPAVGRVVRTERLSGPNRWRVVVMLPPVTAAAYYWQALDAAVPQDTFIKMAGGGTRMEFWCRTAGRVAVLTSSGDLLVRGTVRVSRIFSNLPSGDWGALAGVPALEVLGSNGATIYGARKRRSGTYNGRFETVFYVAPSQLDFVLYGFDDGAGGLTQRSVQTQYSALSGTGANGIVDSGSGGTTGNLDFYVGGRLVARINDGSLLLKGTIRAGAVL